MLNCVAVGLKTLKCIWSHALIYVHSKNQKQRLKAQIFIYNQKYHQGFEVEALLLGTFVS